MLLIMDEGEILREYRAAKKKTEQVRILAELNCCSKKEMATWLKDHGETVDKRYFREPPVRKPKQKEEREEHMEETRTTTDAPHRAELIMPVKEVVTSEAITPEPDMVNHPPHYTDGGIETLDFIEAKGLGYCLGSVVKYVSRAGKKDPAKKLEDLKKAQFFLNRYIAREEERNANKG